MNQKTPLLSPNAPPSFLHVLPFDVFRLDKNARQPQPHFHMDVEMLLVIEGHMDYRFGGQNHALEAGELIAFWAGMPHQLLESGEALRAVCLQVPLLLYHGWGLPEEFSRRLFGGEMVRENYAGGMRAAALLERKGAAVREIDVSNDPATRERLLRETGSHTVPQIFINGVSVGGFDDISALERRGTLDAMLREAPARGVAPTA